jgi:hypothetical protein
MAYVPQYVTSDITPITIDIIGIFGASLAGQAGTLAQLVVLGVLIGVIGGVIYALSGLAKTAMGLVGHK